MNFLVYLFCLAFVACSCNGADEVVKDITFKYIIGDKSDSDKRDALNAIHSLKDWLNSFPNRQSFKVTSGNVIGYMWVGGMVQNSGFSGGQAMQVIQDEVNNYGIPKSVFIEYVDTDPMKTFGIILNTGGSSQLGQVQDAVKTWSQGKSYTQSTGSKAYNGKSVCYLSYANRKKVENDNEAGECFNTKVEQGKSIEDTAGVNGESLQGYNPTINFNMVSVGQPFCSSIGTLPNFKPNKNSDGSCFSHVVKSGDTCSSIIASYYPLSIDDLNQYNKNTYGWKGCSSLQLDQNICLSDGNAPRPKSNPLAECGPLAPGDLYNRDCPLNACCSEFGFCGLTSEFCDKKPSDTNAPGTTGCFSNCGYGSVHTDVRSDFENVAYWLDAQGQMATNPLQIKDPHTIVHYAFVKINADFSIDDSNISVSDFLSIPKKRVASFGGWDFSTSPNTYKIFRDGVTSQNRETLADNMVNFLNKYSLDGLDLDWEYPGAPDIPGIPADSKDSGNNYLEFVKLLKSKLPSGKTLSMAIPSSFWYLKNYPITQIQDYLDYMVFMTYDIYGTWDIDKDNSIKCHANKSAIVDSLKMLDKAGVQIGKTYGGLSNYGRSYKASDSSCLKQNCPFSGPGASRSLTNTPGVLSDSEIVDVDASSAKNDRWYDSVSDCIFMRYDGDSIVGWTNNREDLRNFFHNSGLKGSVLWVDNYFKHDEYNPSNDDDDDYETDADEQDYVDEYGCGTINISTQDQLDNVDENCLIEGIISFAINAGKNAITKIGVLKNNKDYPKNFAAYTSMIQDEIMIKYSNLVFAPYDHKTEQNALFSCPKNEKCGKYINNAYVNGCSNITPSKSPTPFAFFSNNTFHKRADTCHEDEDGISFAELCETCNPGKGKSPGQGIVYFKDIKGKDYDGIAEFTGKQFNMTLVGDDFEDGDWDNLNFGGMVNPNADVYDNSVIPKAVKILPDPMVNMTENYIDEIRTIIDGAQSSLGKEMPLFILSVIFPVTTFASVVDSIQEINDTGKEIRKIESKERKNMIFMIVSTIVGMLTLPLEVTGAIIDVLTVIIGWGVTGDVNPLDLLGMFGAIGAGFKAGKGIREIGSDVTISQDFKKLNLYKYNQIILRKLGKSCSA